MSTAAGHGPCRVGLVSIALALVACGGPRDGEVPGDTVEPLPSGDRRGSMEELRDLIREGVVAPVQAEVSETQEYADPVGLGPDGSSDLPGMGVPSTLETRGLAGPEEADVTGLLPERGTANWPAEQGGPRVGELDLLGGFAENPYLRFGERILVHSDGTLTKPFPLQAGRGRKLLHLMTVASGFPLEYRVIDPGGEPQPAQAEPLPAGTARVVLLERFDFEQYQNFQPGLDAAPSNAVDLNIADWLVVRADEELLAEVQRFVELFAGAVPQVEIEARIVEVTTTDELDYGVRGPDGSVLVDFPAGTFVDSLAFGVPNVADANEALLTIGTIADGVVINAVIEAIETWENVTITTRPKIAVREGGVAEVINTREVPFFEFSGLSSTNQNFNANLKFKEVGTKLFVAPRVVGTETLALNLFIEASQQIGTAIAFFDAEGNQFSSPLIAKRQARTVVYLEPGQALVIGGLEAERDVESTRKVPILGDIPLLGLLFRSQLVRKERTNVLFFIRPRLLQGADYTDSL